MNDILAKRHGPLLASFGLSNVLLAFDFDGTLAPVVDDPAAAWMRESTRRLLADVATSYPCVVISGRARHDVAARLKRVPIAHVTGNFGIEPWAQRDAYRERVARWIAQLSPRLAPLAGVSIEDKVYSLTVHYRHAPQPAKAARAVARAVRALRGARSIVGAQATSVVPRDAPTKAAALKRAVEVFACDTAIYVGDDGTDEEAFTALAGERLLGVRVGITRRSRARFGLRRQQDVDEFLRRLLTIRDRSRPATRRRRATSVR